MSGSTGMRRDRRCRPLRNASRRRVITVRRRAAEIGESLDSFTSGVRLSVARLTELADHTDITVAIYLYDLLPTWRVIALDETMFVSAFGADSEGHTSPMYKITSSAHVGALHRGFRRFIGELLLTSRRVV